MNAAAAPSKVVHSHQHLDCEPSQAVSTGPNAESSKQNPLENKREDEAKSKTTATAFFICIIFYIMYIRIHYPDLLLPSAAFYLSLSLDDPYSQADESAVALGE